MFFSHGLIQNTGEKNSGILCLMLYYRGKILRRITSREVDDALP